MGLTGPSVPEGIFAPRDPGMRNRAVDAVGGEFLRAVQPQPIGAGGWINQNPPWDEMLYKFGADVQPGPGLHDFGMKPFSSDTAEHGIYGWRKLVDIRRNGNVLASADVIERNFRKVMANDLCRRIAYSGPGSEYRYGGYDKTMRPVGWTVEIPGTGPKLINGDSTGTNPSDLKPGFPAEYPIGSTKRSDWNASGDYLWTGYDLEHNWDAKWEIVSQLIANLVPTGFPAGLPQTYPIAILAAHRLHIHAEATAGVVRNPFELNWATKLNIDTIGDRNWAGALGVLFWAAYYNCTNHISAGSGGTDIDAAFLAFLRAAIQFYLHQPGVAVHSKDPGGSDVPAVPAGNEYIIPIQLAWVMTRFYDIRVALAQFNATFYAADIANLDTCIIRMSKWIVECALGCGAPNAGKNPWRVSFPAGALGPTIGLGLGAGQIVPGTSIPNSLIGVGAVMHFDAFNPQETWLFRALRIADLYATAGAAAKWAQILINPSNYNPGLQNQQDPLQWKWLVGADMRYVPAAAAAICNESPSVL